MSMVEQVRPQKGMNLLARLEDRARHVARQLGHDLGPLRPGQVGEHHAACRRCGGLAIITPSHGLGIRGTACSVQCRTRRRLRPLPSTLCSGGNAER
jgi:hypothetical protein